jgi:hypothetical protein
VASLPDPTTGTFTRADGQNRIGSIPVACPTNRYFWQGQIDEVEIFNRALSASEIQAIDNAGSAGKCKASPTPTPTPTSTATATPAGIAARYPGDNNIASDPDVIFADDFESYSSASDLTSKWDSVSLKNTRIATEPENVFAGGKSLEFTLPISTTETVNSANKVISPPLDVVFIRAYSKFSTDYHVVGSDHNGIRLTAKYPGGAGVPAPRDGTGFFLFALQNNIQGRGRPDETDPGYCHIYAYWPYQRNNYGDHWYPDGFVLPGDCAGLGADGQVIRNRGNWLAFPNNYPDFQPMPNWLPERGRWYCYELMVKANTPGQNDGEVKYWIDCNVVSDFPNLNMRSIASLQIDNASLRLHAIHSEQVNKKWYDNVVVAKSYIGPMAGSTPTPTPSPTVSPSATPTPSPTPTPTPTPTSTIQMTVQTSPAGLTFSVDGTSYTATQVFSWSSGSSHTIATTSPQNGATGVQYVWNNWSGGGAISHTVAPTTNKAYTATFTTQYYLTMTHGTGGTVSPASGWKNSGTAVSITATPTKNTQVSYRFAGWAGTGTGSYTGTNNPASITMNGPVTENATFIQNPIQITVQTNPAGPSFSVDGMPYAATQSFSWDPGSSHTIATTSPQSGGPGVQHVWKSWSDKGATSHTVAPTSNATYTGNFTTQYYLTLTHGTGGTVSPATGWKNSGAAISITAKPASGYSFSNWSGNGTGSFSGTTNPVSIQMLGPITETASFSH